MSDALVRILLCGDFDAVEMRPIAACIARVAPRAELRHTPALTECTVKPSNAGGEEVSWTPDLIVVAQMRPDQFPQSDVRRLQARYPLARCVCCCGVWCESNGRNSNLWPDAVRVSARTAELRIQQELAVLEGRRPPLPLTASRDEIFAFDSPGDWEPHGNDVTVCVKSPDRELRRAFEDLLKSGGFDVVTAESDVARAAVVWDVDPWCGSLATEIQNFCRQQPQVRVVALMSFGHPQAAEVLSCGVQAVVAKLSPAEQLFDALAELLLPQP